MLTQNPNIAKKFFTFVSFFLRKKRVTVIITKGVIYDKIFTERGIFPSILKPNITEYIFF